MHFARHMCYQLWTEVNVIGDCGKLDMDLETPAQRFVKPGDLVSLGSCGECGNWLKPGSLLSVTIEQPAARAGGEGRGVMIVDERGHMVKRGTAALEQTLSFAPRASFHCKAPGSEAAAFQKTKYFIQMVPLDEGDESVDVDVDVDVNKDLVE
jgi:hypothetical protein